MSNTETSRRTLFVISAFLVFSALVLITVLPETLTAAEKKPESQAEQLRAGKNYIPTKVYTIKQDQDILKLFEGLRVTDVCDGMDKAGLKNIGLMSPEIMPLWKDFKHFKHRCIGIAVTVRYVPTNEPHMPAMDTEKFDKWVSDTYNKVTSEPFVELIREGTVLVFDDAPDSDVGTIGSNNIMGWHLKGCVGVVTNATARDTDEIVAEKVPLYFRKVGRGIRPGRNEVESVNRPIECGGVLVEPGDVIIADGDGVLVVPRSHAKEVALYARATLDIDKGQRRDLYDKLGLEHDDSVK